ncbi:MAG: GTPase Era [Deltaproteobacteria bacterium]|jgi:GTP-binding protein Era|nr:GTPase Era [Deltaproteobacteria bacterium]
MISSQRKFRSGFVAIVGRPNVGKSTLLNQLVGQKIAITSQKPQTTRNRILGILTADDVQVVFVDTPGFHHAKSPLNRFMMEQARSACFDVDLILWLVEANRPFDQQPMIQALLKQSARPVVLGINKIDLINKDRLLPLIDEYRQICPFAAIVPCSALRGEGMAPLLEELIKRLPEGPRLYPEDQVTDVPERFIVAEMIREQVLNRTRDEVPYGVAVVIERFQENPVRNMVGIDAVINVERDMHKRILIGKGGQMIRTIGQSARGEIERFLGIKVHLELFVRVQKNWTGSKQLLKDFGYD